MHSNDTNCGILLLDQYQIMIPEDKTEISLRDIVNDTTIIMDDGILNSDITSDQIETSAQNNPVTAKNGEKKRKKIL